MAERNEYKRFISRGCLDKGKASSVCEEKLVRGAYVSIEGGGGTLGRTGLFSKDIKLPWTSPVCSRQRVPRAPLQT